MDAQEDKYQSTLSQLIGDISELRASTQKLSDENLSLRNQVLVVIISMAFLSLFN